ncbi:MAG: hypothetical protein QMB03_07300, partial [Spirosomataceae bacterium]
LKRIVEGEDIGTLVKD